MNRLLIAAVVGLLSAGHASAFFPGASDQPCDMVPPKSAQQPVADVVWIYEIPQDRMHAQCNAPSGGVMYGCAALKTDKHPALIFLNAALDPAERACTLLYEKAHLPPNNWQDPVVEARMR